MKKFREIDVSGDAHARGLMHGEQMSGEIADALTFYKDIFKQPATVVLEQARHFQRVIADFNAEYATEINGIAEGAGQDPLWIVALNARTEILGLLKQDGSNTPINECTSMCFKGPPILGQTWDWGLPLESLCAIMRIERPDGHVIRMLTEPGILGKIGMNSAGLGVCLNILTLGQPLTGVPVHVLLRGILDCASASEATAMIHGAALGTSSNVMVADKSGHCFDLEFAGAETLSPDYGDGNLVHTNHYLGEAINAADDPLFFNSHARMRRASERVVQAPEHTATIMCDILSDRSHNTFPIYRPYVPDDSVQDVGTVATIVMDLGVGEMHVRKGAELDNGFTTYTM
jgi:isopenicillin-N N-acyltransferase like protein